MRVENLEKIVDKVVSSIDSFDKFENLVSFCGKGTIFKMSANNIALVYDQKPDATFVTTFDYWKKIGRYPKQKTGIMVYPDSQTGIFARFSDVYFDISDTDGKEIKPWSMTSELMDKYVQNMRSGLDYNIGGTTEEFCQSYFYLISDAAFDAYDTLLPYAEKDNYEARVELQKLIARQKELDYQLMEKPDNEEAEEQSSDINMAQSDAVGSVVSTEEAVGIKKRIAI